MALSGSFSTNKYTTSSHGSIGLNLSWTATQSIANNTTTISWKLKSNGTMSSGYYVQGGPITLTINGSKRLNLTGRFDVRGGGGFSRSGTYTITHNTDGTKTVSMSVKAALYSASVNCTASKSYTLNKIPRYAIISSATSFDDEGFPTLIYSNPAGTALTTGLKARLAWTGGNSDWVTLNDAGGEYTWDNTTLTDANKAAMLAACPTSNTLPVNIELASTLGGVEYTDEKAVTMSVINANPTPGAVSYADQDAAIIAKTGKASIIVQNYSTLRIQTAASSGKKGATITAYKLSVNGNDYDITTDLYKDFIQPDLAGDFTAVITTTDSRGNTASASVNFTIQEYIKPSANIYCSRVDNFYSETILKVTAKISAIADTNSYTITERHKELPSGNWSQAQTIQDDQDTQLNLTNTSEWEVEIVIEDEYQQTTYTATIAKGIPILFIDRLKHSVGVNGLPDASEQLYIGGTVKATGKITAPSMSVQDISNAYTITKTSGNWTLKEIGAVRSGSVVHMRLAFSGNGSSVSAGSNGFVGTITNGPKPALSMKLVAYYNNAPIMLNIEPDGAITARVTAVSVTVTTTGTLAPTGTFITNE